MYLRAKVLAVLVAMSRLVLLLVLVAVQFVCTAPPIAAKWRFQLVLLGTWSCLVARVDLRQEALYS